MASNNRSAALLREELGKHAAGARRDWNPYRQVALTYLRRPFSSPQASIVSSIAAGTVGLLLLFHAIDQLRHPAPSEGFPLVSLPLVAIAFLAGSLAMHIKEQFADWRSHLLPGSRRVHMAVAAAMIVMALTVTPPILTWLIGLRFVSLGVVAVTVLVFGAMSWSVLVLSNWIIWPFIGLMLLGFSQSSHRALVALVAGHFEREAAALLVLGAATIVLAGMRLFQLNEEMPEYHRRMRTIWTETGRATSQNASDDVPLPRTLTDWFRQQAMAHLTYHVRRAATSRWSQICRWQAGMPTGWGIWLWGLVPIGCFQFLSGYLSWALPGTPQSNMATSATVANSFAFFPVMLVVPQLMSWLVVRTRTMGYEVMLPVDRRTYVRQLIAALATASFEFCGVILTSTVLWCLVAVATPPPLGYLGGLAAVVLLTQVLQFGAMVFAHTLTSLQIVHLAVFIVPMVGSMFLITGSARTDNFQLLPEVWPIAAALAALGVLLVYVAYRRWLVADFA